MPLACARQPEAPEKAPPAPVQAVGLREYGAGQWTDLSGTTQPLPRHAARISAAVDGKVESILTGADGKSLQEGQPVRAGDVVVQLDARVAQANRDKLAATQKVLEQQIKQADITVQVAEEKVKRFEGLLAGGRPTGDTTLLASPVDLRDAQFALKTAQSQQAQAVASQDAGAKELKALDAQLALYSLKAPIAGRLGIIQVMPGQSLTIGTTVADVIDLDDIQVLCYVPPHLAGLVAVKQPAMLPDVKDSKNKPLTGNVVFVAEAAQADSGNFTVKVQFKNPGHVLRANAIVRVQIQTQPEKPRLTVPEAALLSDQDPPGVVVVEDVKERKNDEGKDEQVGKARLLQATVGIRIHLGQTRDVEILDLRDPETKKKVALEGALFVVKGGQGLRNGDEVVLQEEGDEDEGK
jgi:RND family efflux transporter MFP subunit